MTETPKAERAGLLKDISSTFRSTSIKALILLPAALFALLAAGHMSGVFSKLSARDMLWTLGTLVFADLLAIIIAVSVARLVIIDKLEAGIATKVDQIDKLLVTCRELKQLMKENKSWLIDDTEVFEIEAAADEEILVISPDLHYENQEEYLKVIIGNLKRPDGPTYKYLLPEDGDTKVQRDDLLRKLRRRLESIGIEDPTDLITKRFVVHLIPEEAFPQSAMYGLAVYKDKQGRVRCLQYMPREFGSLNVEIPSEGDLGRRLISRTRSHFDRLVSALNKLATSN